MSSPQKPQDVAQNDDDSEEMKQIDIIASQLPGYCQDYSRYQGSVNPKSVTNILRQFELDPNICLIKTVVKKNDDSFSSRDENEVQDITQNTIKMQFLMNRFNVEDQSLLGDALVKDSLESYFYNLEKRTKISKQFQDQSDSYQFEKDSFINWSKYNQILKEDKKYDFNELSKIYENKDDSIDENGEQVQKTQKKKTLQNWQKEINLLNQNAINDLYSKMSKGDEKEKEQEEKFRLNKTFDFGRNQLLTDLQNKSDIIQEKYQEDFFEKLPSDIETIHQHLVEYIDFSGEASIQPSNLVELREEQKSQLGLSDIQNDTQHFNFENINAIYKDYIETFSTVIERENQNQIGLFSCQKEISPISRQVILQEPNMKIENQDQVEMIKDYENQIDLEKIHDFDIFNIVSGRIDSQALFTFVQKYEQFQSKQTKNMIKDHENARVETEKVLNQIRAKFIKKGKEDKDSQACFFNKEEKILQIQKDKSDPESDTVSVCSYLNKSQKSQDKNQKTPIQSTRASIVGFNSRKQSTSLTPIKKADPARKSIVPGMNPRSSITNRSSFSIRPSFANRKGSNSLNQTQLLQSNIQVRKDSQAFKLEKEELASVQSLDSEINEQQEENDENTQQKEEYTKMVNELDAIETEHNQLLKAILSVQISPKIHAIFKEIKDLRVLRKYILNSQDINEAIKLTKELNQQISTKFKEMIMLLFDDQSVSFEQGLENLMKSLSKINQKENTIEQAKLKIIFSLLNQFRISLEDNQFDQVSLQQQSDPEVQFKKIQEALDKYQNRKNMSQSERNKIETQSKMLDFSKISFYNYRQKKVASNSELNSNKNLNESMTSSSQSSLSQFNLPKQNFKKQTSNTKKEEPKKEQKNVKRDLSAKNNDLSFSFEKYTNPSVTPKVKIGLEPVSSLASLNTGANTHKSTSTASKTFTFLKVKSYTSLAKSPSNLSQILSLSPLPQNQDSPFLKDDLEHIQELDLNKKQPQATAVKQIQPPSPKKNFWNQAKFNIFKTLESNKQNHSPEKKKNVTFSWQQLIKEQKQKQLLGIQQDQKQIELQNKKLKVLELIENHESIISTTLNTSRNNSSSRKILSDQKDIKSGSSLDKTKQLTNPFQSAKKCVLRNFSPVGKEGKEVKSIQNQIFQTPKRNQNTTQQVQSESKLLKNKSQSIFEYKAKENKKTFMDLTRKDLYTRSQKSVDKVEKYFEQFIQKSKEIAV